MPNHIKLSRFISKPVKTLGIGLAFASLLTSAKAADLFQVGAFTTDAGPPVNLTVGSSSILDVVESLINNTGDFQSLSTRDFDAALTYGGVPHAINFSVTGNQATLTIPSTGFSRTFNGASRHDVENQIEDFLEKDGLNEYSKFLKSINEKSPIAASDGNPNASTATLAAQTFMDYAFPSGETRAEKEEGGSEQGRVGFGFMGDVGTFDANGIKGTTYSLPLFAKFKLTDRVGLGINIPLQYTEIEGAQVFGGGLNLALPIKAIVRSKENPWTWNITPSGGVLASASKDLLAGGVISQVGLASMLSYDFEHLTLTMGNYLGWFEGVPVEFGGVSYDPNISQQILKNGLKVSVPFKQHWVVEFYGIHTKFVNAAAVDQYGTVGGELGWKPNPKKRRYWKVGIYADIGDDFASAHAQFGSAWKF